MAEAASGDGTAAAGSARGGSARSASLAQARTGTHVRLNRIRRGHRQATGEHKEQNRQMFDNSHAAVFTGKAKRSPLQYQRKFPGRPSG